MNIPSIRFTALTLSALVLCGSALWAQPGEAPSVKKEAAFGQLEPPARADVRAQAEAWLKKKNGGSLDALLRIKFEMIWKDASRPLFDQVTETLVLGDPNVAGKLLAAIRDGDIPPPSEVPAVLIDRG